MRSKEALERLRQLLGDELYRRTVEELAGMTVYFPTDYEWSDKVTRNDSIKEDYYSGEYEIRDLAIKYNLSISRVYKIIQQRE